MLFVYAFALAAQAAAVPVEQLLLKQAGEVQLVYPLHKKIEVSPGQQFYGEFRVVAKHGAAYRIASPFKSSMGGSMGLPFAFAIDETELVPFRSSAGWNYFIPKGKQFRAWHGLLGNVLADGDTVGLRVHQDGRREWFVDNSKHNGMTTIWTRKIKEKDPAISVVQTATAEPVGPIQRLVYLGASGGEVKIRHEQIYPDGSITRDDYEFAVDADGVAVGAVMGASFKVEPKPLGATVEILSAMTGDSGSVLSAAGSSR